MSGFFTLSIFDKRPTRVLSPISYLLIFQSICSSIPSFLASWSLDTFSASEFKRADTLGHSPKTTVEKKNLHHYLTCSVKRFNSYHTPGPDGHLKPSGFPGLFSLLSVFFCCKCPSSSYCLTVMPSF